MKRKDDDATVTLSAGGKSVGPMSVSEFKRRTDRILRGGNVGAPTEEVQVVFDFVTAQRQARQIQESRALLKREVEKLGDAVDVLAGTTQQRAVETLTEEVAARKKGLLEDEELQELKAKRKAAVKKAKATGAGQKVAEVKLGVKALRDGIANAQRQLAEGMANGSK